jgi:hypothetical protein
MRFAVTGFGLAALLGVVGAQAQSSGTPNDQHGCSKDATAGPCTPANPSDPGSSDLTPTQWLFGKDPFSKLGRTPTATDLQLAGHVNWSSVFSGADESLKAGGTGKGGSRHAATDASHIASTQVTAAPGASQSFLVEEWRRTELAVADSVYHEDLAFIASAFDSAERSPVSDVQRMQIMRHLDALLARTNATWVTFRAEVTRRADSALAALNRTAPAK